MSSTTPMLLRSLNRYLIADTKSGASSVRLSSGVSRPILMLNFKRPTRLKSYLRGSKNMLRKKHVHFGDAAFGKRLPELGGQRLVGFQQDFPGLAIDDIGDAVGALQVGQRGAHLGNLRLD